MGDSLFFFFSLGTLSHPWSSYKHTPQPLGIMGVPTARFSSLWELQPLFRITFIELAQSSPSSFYRNHLYFIHLPKEIWCDQNNNWGPYRPVSEAHLSAAGEQRHRVQQRGRPCGPQACLGCGQLSVAICFAEGTDPRNNLSEFSFAHGALKRCLVWVCYIPLYASHSYFAQVISSQ